MKTIVISISVLAICIVLTMPDSSLAQTANQNKKEPSKSKVVEQEQGRQAPAGKDVVIGYLESRDRVVTLFRGAKGTVCTVKTKDGKTLATKINEKDLQAQYPALYDQIKYGVAGNDATLRRSLVQPAQAPAK
jgi:hypothetical protein